jgi:hypothetical protein
VLALGELLPMSQWVSYSVILGMGRHKAIALLSVVENIVTVALVFLLVGPYGLLGVSVAVAVPGMLCRGLCQWLYCCRLVQVSPWTSLARSFAPTIVLALPSMVVLAAWTWWFHIDSWLELMVAGAIYGLTFLATAGLGLLGVERGKYLVGFAEKPAPLAAMTSSPSETCLPGDTQQLCVPGANGKAAPLAATTSTPNETCLPEDTQQLCVPVANGKALATDKVTR